MSAVLLCDHHLDPRLVRRKVWLENIFGTCDIYVDKSRGEHFRNDDIIEKDLKNLKSKDIDYVDLIYISGGKIIISKFFLLFLARIKGKRTVYEIPDLPLRDKSIIRNKIISLVFYLFVLVLFKRVVITSSAFKTKLPKCIDYYVCENLPSNVPQSINYKSPDSMTISFVGVIRYLEQMKLLIKYASIRKVKVRFHGGPDSAISELEEYSKSLNNKPDVTFYGRFTPSDLSLIYDNTTFVYSVYDAGQENVRLALPNKLYESILFEKPIISSSNTYLGDVISRERCGFSVDSSCFNKFCKAMDVGLFEDYFFNSKNLKDKIRNQESNFVSWLKK